MKQRIRSVAIIGLGQIGGSLALALRKALPALRMTGIDTSRKRIALLRRTLSNASTKWSAAEDADVIFVCLHFRETMEYLARAPRKPMIVDVCSAKRKVVARANRRKLRFIGGHPMAGNERSAEKGWNARLFENAPFFLCPAAGATTADLATAKRFARSIQARPIVVDPAEHDHAAALTSHLPALLSIAYLKFTETVPPEYQGPGYQSFTRLAHSPPALIHTFLESNGDLIRKALRQWRRVAMLKTRRKAMA